MGPDDVDAVLAAQEPAAVAGLGHIFAQDRFPFPRAEVRSRWLAEIADPQVECFVITRDGAVAGFAAVRGAELLHFGTALEAWGTGLARTALAELVDRWHDAGFTAAWLWVFEENHRGRRFYERNGWVPTGEVSRGRFAPYPRLVRYRLAPISAADPASRTAPDR